MDISEQGQMITHRFFEAVQVLRDLGEIRGLKTVTDKCNANYWNICTLRREPDRRVLKPELLSCLVTEYGVSARWLLTGQGSIFDTL